MRLRVLRRLSNHPARAMTNNTRNAKNRISAILGTAAAISVKAKTPDTAAIARKIMAILNIYISSLINLLLAVSGTGLANAIDDTAIV
jgi:hypothetical protein